MPPFRPHERAPVILGGAGDPIDPPALFAEPPPRAPLWLPACYLRLLAASTGPVCVAAALPVDLTFRLERARWPLLAAGADPFAASAAAWPALPRLRELAWGVGSPFPSLVLVGERDTPLAGGRPFFAPCGTWLLRALRELGHDELTLYLTNAFLGGVRQDGKLAALAEALAPAGPTWVALGEVADLALRMVDVDHLLAPHPSWHKRRRTREDVPGYAARLKVAGVPAGPWAGAAPPAIAGLPPADFLEAWDVPPSAGGGSLIKPGSALAGGGRGRARSTIARPRLDRARLAYVTGEVKTLRAAADLIGADGAAVWAYAAEQEWEVERDAYRDKVRTEALERSAAAEGKVIANARRLAWSGTLQALQGVVKRYAAGDRPAEFPGTKPLEPQPKDAWLLSQAALALSDRQAGDAVAGAEAERLRALPLGELAAELEKTLKAQFGAGVVRA